MRTGTLLAVDTALEGATGLLLVGAPGILSRLLFAAGLDGPGTIMGRLAGIALFALALACWIARTGPGVRASLAGMLAFNVLAAGYLAVLGFGGQAGVLLWPMVALHAAMTALFARAWASDRASWASDRASTEPAR